MAVPTPLQVSPYNPFRPPNWRFERVLSILDSIPRGRCSRHDDDLTKRLKRFIVRYRRTSDIEHQRLYREEPGMYLATMLYEQKEENPQVSQVVEARLLARQDDTEIAALANTHPDAVDMYEKLYFNVRPHLYATDWIMTQVLTPAIVNVPLFVDGKRYRPPLSEPFFDATLKYFAYFGGPIVCDFMIHGGRLGSQPTDNTQLLDYLEDEYKHKLYRRTVSAVQTFEVNNFNIGEVLSMFTATMNLRMNHSNEEQAKDAVHTGFQQMLSSMLFTVGEAGSGEVAGTPVADYDEAAAELRTHQLLEVSAGVDAGKYLEQLQTEMPPAPEGNKEAAKTKISDDLN